MTNKGLLRKIFGETIFADPELFGERGKTEAPAGQVGKYRGVRIYRRGDSYYTSLDPDSEFESVSDAKKVIAHFRRGWKNPAEGHLVIPATGGHIVIPVRKRGKGFTVRKNPAAGFVDSKGRVHPLR